MCLYSDVCYVLYGDKGYVLCGDVGYWLHGDVYFIGVFFGCDDSNGRT